MTLKAQVEHISSAPARESGRYRGLAAAPPRAAGWLGLPDVRLPVPIAGIRAQGRFSQLSARDGHYRDAEMNSFFATRSPHPPAAESMGVSQGRAPWRSCGSQPSQILSET